MAVGRTNAGSSGGGAGAALTVTAPPGVTVTIIKDGKTKIMTANAQGIAVFKGLETGNWTVTIANEMQTAEKAVAITADYNVVIAFFAANISVVYPAGSVCTCSNGNVSLSAPDTSGSHTFVVPNTGTWTVSCTDGSATATGTVSITADGQSKSVELAYSVYVFKSGDGALETISKASATDRYYVTIGNEYIEGHGYDSSSAADYVSFYTAHKNLAGYNTLYFDVKVTEAWSGEEPRFGVASSTIPASGSGASKFTTYKVGQKGNRQTIAIDISSNNSGYIGAWGVGNFYVYNIWYK